jgi:hypothetical protein
VWAFSDESERAGVMLYAVVVIAPADIEAARAQLRRLLLAGERTMHTAKESPRRRKTLLDAVARIEGLSAVVLRLRRPPGVTKVAARHLLLQAATATVVGRGVTSWVLDDMVALERVRDRASIGHALAGVDRRLHPVYDHRPASSEPLLWAADAICWAVGAGGEWRARVGTVTVADIGP